MSVLLPLLLLSAGCLSAGSPAPGRAFGAGALPGGLPLTTLFAVCESGDPDSEDIGPCLAELLTGAIEVARPSFESGVEIGRDVIVLEPLDLDDIDPKKNKEFQVSVTDLKLYGIGTLQIHNITFDTDMLALNLSFDYIAATGHMLLKYLFITASPDVRIQLDKLGVQVRANWNIEQNPDEPGRLDIVLNNATAKFDVHDLSAQFEGLGGLGRFAQKIINKNSRTLVSILIPDLERTVNKKLNTKLNRIKIVD